ncbi:MAG: HIT domain-containing protein [Dehalococcoidales bacterium]|jgi:ATP adenylyltransferase
MDTIWAPWRIKYIEMAKPAGCILCSKPGEDNDAENYILHRARHNFIILNSYPYNPGHLMVVPYRHVASPEELTGDEILEHWQLINRSLGILRDSFGCHDFNIGMNLGSIAGAGIAEHIHSHIVPRWQGDTNFMPVIGSTRVVPQALEETYLKLHEKFI